MTFALLALIVIVLVASSGRQRGRWARREEELSEGIHAELDELRVRVAELEDHREFAERLLTDRAASPESE